MMLRTRHIARAVIGLLIAHLASGQILVVLSANRQLGETYAAQAKTTLFADAPLSRTRQGRTQGAPPLLSFADLNRLYEDENPPDELQRRLTQLLNTPFVANAASARGIKPLKPNSQTMGRFIRVATWNIERGLEFDAVRAAFTHDQKFFRRIDQSGLSSKGSQLANVLSQSQDLRQADIVVLNEVDWGLKRTVYRNVAKELADAMGMNYAYGVEFVEVDPLTLERH